MIGDRELVGGGGLAKGSGGNGGLCPWDPRIPELAGVPPGVVPGGRRDRPGSCGAGTPDRGGEASGGEDGAPTKRAKLVSVNGLNFLRYLERPYAIAFSIAT